MAFNAGSITATLELDLSKFKASLNKVKNEAGKAGGRLSGLGRSLRRLNQVGGKAALALGAAGLAGGAIAAGLAVSKLTGFVKAGIAAQAGYEQAVASLGAALRIQGIANVEAITKSVEDFAAEFQRATGFADDAAIQIAQTLTSLGAAGKVDLAAATETVVDFSKALNIDANTAARSFGQALAGNAATLGRYLPAVKDLTVEQLKAGKAFELAQQGVGGFTRALGETFQGRLDRLSASFQDFQKRFGAAFIEALAPVVTQVQQLFDFMVDGLAQTTPEFEKLTELTQQFGEFLANALDRAIPLLFNMVARFQDLRATFQTIIGTAAQAQASVVRFVANVRTAVSDALQGISETIRQLPLVGEAIAGAFQQAAQNAAQAAAEANRVADEFDTIAAQAAEANSELQRSAENIRAMGEGLNQARKNFADVDDAATDTKNETAAAANNIKAATQDAEQLGTALDGAARAAARIDVDLGGAGGAGGAGGDGEGGGFSAAGFGAAAFGGSRRLNLDDPFSALSEAQQAESFLRQTTQGGLVAGVANFQINQARQFADAVRAEATASFNKALREFTTDIVSELNRAGVLDPTDRSRILRERIAEAQRLGIIPAPARGTSAVVR